MRILVGTPAGGGQISTQYMLSFLSMLSECVRHKIEPILYTLSQESLLPRGRNHIAQVCMKDKYDKLFFIDADSGWHVNDFLQIALSPFPVVAGTVPLKTYPIILNYLPFKEDEKYFKNAMRSPESTRKMREAKGMAEIPVAFVGTAFLCIDAQVLYKLAETETTYKYPNPFSGQQEVCWDFFGPKSVNDTYYSEDWVFCHKVREAGYDVRINADVAINHVGNHVYRVNPGVPVDQAAEIFRPLLYRIQNADEGEFIKINEFVADLVKTPIQESKIHSPSATLSNPVKEMTNDATTNAPQS